MPLGRLLTIAASTRMVVVKILSASKAHWPCKKLLPVAQPFGMTKRTCILYDYNNHVALHAIGMESKHKLWIGVTTVRGYTAGVGLYTPPGNVQGKFAQNVLPLS